jgi:hypothetical protein
VAKDYKKIAFDQFEQQGEDYVRLWLAETQNSTFHEIKIRRGWATQWLAQFDRQSRLAIEQERLENRRTARSAKNAAWAAAIAAIIAAIAAIASAVIAFSGGLS